MQKILNTSALAMELRPCVSPFVCPSVYPLQVVSVPWPHAYLTDVFHFDTNTTLVVTMRRIQFVKDIE